MRLTVRGVVFSALFAALLVVLSYFQLPIGPVPIVLENIVVLMAGALLGPLYGFLSMALLVVLVLAGLPLLDGAGGLTVLAGPSGGYVWAWPFAALLIGLVVPRLRGGGVGGTAKSAILAFIWMEIFGVFFVDIVGSAWLMHVGHYSLAKTLQYGIFMFLLGDTLKTVLVTVIWASIRNIYPISRLTGRGGQTVVKVSPAD